MSRDKYKEYQDYCKRKGLEPKPRLEWAEVYEAFKAQQYLEDLRPTALPRTKNRWESGRLSGIRDDE